MKVYGIARELWGGSDYYCDYSEDIILYLSKEKRDEKWEELHDNLPENQDIIYSRFETEIEE